MRPPLSELSSARFGRRAFVSGLAATPLAIMAACGPDASPTPVSPFAPKPKEQAKGAPSPLKPTPVFEAPKTTGKDNQQSLSIAQAIAEMPLPVEMRPIQSVQYPYSTQMPKTWTYEPFGWDTFYNEISPPNLQNLKTAAIGIATGRLDRPRKQEDTLLAREAQLKNSPDVRITGKSILPFGNGQAHAIFYNYPEGGYKVGDLSKAFPKLATSNGNIIGIEAVHLRGNNGWVAQLAYDVARSDPHTPTIFFKMIQNIKFLS